MLYAYLTFLSVTQTSNRSDSTAVYNLKERRLRCNFCSSRRVESVALWLHSAVILSQPLEEQLIPVCSITRSRYCISGPILKRQADSSPRLFSRQCGKNLLTFLQEKARPSSYARATERNCNCFWRSWEAKRLKNKGQWEKIVKTVSKVCQVVEFELTQMKVFLNQQKLVISN